MKDGLFLLLVRILLILQVLLLCFSGILIDAAEVPTPHNATVRVPLMANVGTHHVQVWVGQPPSLQTLIVDTGSRLSAWVCEPCMGCGQHESGAKYYDPLASSTSSVTIHALQHRSQPKGKKKNKPHLDTHSSCQCQFPVSACEHNQCVMQQHYTEGSTWKATEVTDMVTLAGAHGSNDEILIGLDNGEAIADRTLREDYARSLPLSTVALTFGCQSKVTGLFKTQQADGILGLEHSDFGFMATLKEHGILKETAETSGTSFSLCFSRDGGWMGLGGSLLDLHHDENHADNADTAPATLQFTPLVKTPAVKGMYSISVTDVWVGETCLTCDAMTDEILRAFAEGKGTIVDSGTTDTYLPQAMEASFSDAWEEATGRSFSDPDERTRAFTDEQWKALPVIKLVLEGDVQLVIPPESYMEPKGTNKRKGKRRFTNGLYMDEPHGAVLGINSMINHDIVFDWDRGVLGIAPADC